MPEQPALPRYTSENTGASLKITIPSKKNWLVISYFSFFLMILVAGETFIGVLYVKFIIDSLSKELDFGPAFDAMMVVNLLIMTFIGGITLYTWLWHVNGRDILEISAKSIQITRRILSFGKPKEYIVQQVKDLRVVPVAENVVWSIRHTRIAWGIPPGTLAFDYGAKTVNFGSGCEEAEAKMILKEIWQAYPQYKPQ